MSAYLDILPSRFAHVFQPPKTLLCESELNDLFAFIWARDPYNHEHPRYRIQIAISILLIYHLGIHPMVALSEGLYYRDITFLLTNQGDELRALCFICLRGRKTLHNSVKRWKGVTMVLADNPKNRSMCPVTLLLAQAIKDGVIDGVDRIHDLSSVAKNHWPAWTTLPYRPGMSDLPILRRTKTAARYIMSLHPIKPSALDKMVRAQIRRAGHELTFTTILDDNKRAAHIFRRERKKLEDNGNPPPVLIGRAQGEIVLSLLTSSHITLSNTPWKVPFLAADSNPECFLHLSSTIEAQLRYDPTRLSIISYLYGICSTYTNLTEILWPFVEAIEAVPYEPFFTEAEPDKHGNCPRCGKRPSRAAMKMHLLRCSQRSKITEAETECNEQVQSGPSYCMWGTCRVSFREGTCTTASQIASHISEHLSPRPLTCLWDGCHITPKDYVEMHFHLEVVHDVMSELTIPTKARFCFQCGVWHMTELDWYLHSVQHARNPTYEYGPVFVNSILAAPGRCPYCMLKGIYQQYENQLPYLNHVAKHIDELEEYMDELTCPHPSCTSQAMDSRELRKHLEEAHNIRLSELD